MTGFKSMAQQAAALAAIVLLLTSAPAEAYLDPGAGGMLVQLVFGGIAAAAVVFRGYLARLLHLFRPGRTGDRPQGR